MFRDIGAFGCLPIGLSLIFASFLTDQFPFIALVCGGLFLYAGMPILIGFLLAHSKRNRQKSVMRNGLVAALLGAIVSPTVIGIMLVVPSYFSSQTLRLWWAWTTLGFTLAGISAVATTIYLKGNKMYGEYKNRSSNNQVVENVEINL